RSLDRARVRGTSVRPDLQQRIESVASELRPEELSEARTIIFELLDALEAGLVRAATREEGKWTVHPWVKQGILLAFRAGSIAELARSGPLSFTDKDTLPPRGASSLGPGVRL